MSSSNFPAAVAQNNQCIVLQLKAPEATGKNEIDLASTRLNKKDKPANTCALVPSEKRLKLLHNGRQHKLKASQPKQQH